MTNLEKLLAAGAENCHPNLVFGEKGNRQTVGVFVHNNEFQPNDAGIALLAKLDAESAPAKKSAKAPKADDIDLS